MAYGGASYNYKGKLLAIYVPAACEGGSPRKNRDDAASDNSRSEVDDNASSRRSTGDSTTEKQGGLFGGFFRGKKSRRGNSPSSNAGSVRNCQKLIKSGRGRAIHALQLYPEMQQAPEIESQAINQGGVPFGFHSDDQKEDILSLLTTITMQSVHLGIYEKRALY